MATVLDRIEHGRTGFGMRRIMVWTAAREEKLLSLWKSRRCLFDPNSVVTKAERQQAFAEVAAEMGVAGSQLTIHLAAVVDS